jgi:hypothetical protein
VPVLPSVGTQPDAVIRRLSIPRAMSAIHRPENRLSALPTAPPAARLTPGMQTATPNDRPGNAAGQAPTRSDASHLTTQPIARASAETSTSADHDAAPLARSEVPDIARASVMSPLSPSSPRPDESRAVERFEAGRPVGTDSPPRALRRQRVSHLTNDWSLVKGSPGALGHAIQPSSHPTSHQARPAVAPVRRSVADPSIAAETTSMRITQPTRSPRGATLHRVGGVVQRTPSAPDGAAPFTTATTTAYDDQPLPEGAGGNELAARFMTELSRSIRSRPVPLPAPFRPLADQITGGRKVMLATDTATRRALRSVGKVAATTGDTIHLDPVATSAARMNHVLAHELTHIANPSPVARFFDDDLDSPEERRAEATAKIMTRSPLAPTSSVLSAPGGTVRRTPLAGSGDTIRRSTDTIHRSPGTIDAESLAASITGTTASRSSSPRSSGSSDVIRRALTETPSVAAQQAGSQNQQGGESVLHSEPPFDPHSDAAKDWFAEQLEKHADAIVRLLGDRLVTDLERRGGRMWGGI